MDKYKDEPYLEKLSVKFGNNEKETQLILTDKHIVFEQEKGLFVKKYRPVYVIDIEDIKIYKDEVQISKMNKEVIIQTNEKDVSFTCGSIIDARKIMERIISIKTDSTAFDRATIKAKKIVKDALTVVSIVGTAAIAVAKNKKAILKVVDGIKVLFKR